MQAAGNFSQVPEEPLAIICAKIQIPKHFVAGNHRHVLKVDGNGTTAEGDNHGDAKGFPLKDCCPVQASENAGNLQWCLIH